MPLFDPSSALVLTDTKWDYPRVAKRVLMLTACLGRSLVMDLTVGGGCRGFGGDEQALRSHVSGFEQCTGVLVG